MNKRIEKVDELIKRELNQILLREVDFPEGAMVTITRADTSGNLMQSKVYISVFPDSKSERVFEILNKLVYFIQQKMNKKLKMRPVPKIIFCEEEKTEEAAKVEEILERLTSGLKKR